MCLRTWSRRSGNIPSLWGSLWGKYPVSHTHTPAVEEIIWMCVFLRRSLRIWSFVVFMDLSSWDLLRMYKRRDYVELYEKDQAKWALLRNVNTVVKHTTLLPVRHTRHRFQSFYIQGSVFFSSSLELCSWWSQDDWSELLVMWLGCRTFNPFMQDFIWFLCVCVFQSGFLGMWNFKLSCFLFEERLELSTVGNSMHEMGTFTILISKSAFFCFVGLSCLESWK